MPWKIAKQSGRYCVVKEADGATVACHETEAEAEAHLAALRADAEGEGGSDGEAKASPSAPADADASVGFDGGEVKALGGGKVGGYLVRFGTPETADVQGEFFDASTYFGRARELDILYDHGMPMRRGGYWPAFRNRPIGSGAVKSMGDGLWFEGELDLRIPRVADLYADVEAGRMGWSSGSTERLVIREPVKSRVGRLVRRILQWPLTEATLSPRPVDPNNRAYALKALPGLAGLADGPGAAPARSLDDDLLRLATDAERLCALTAQLAEHRKAEGRNLSPHRIESIKAASEAFDALLLGCEAAATAGDAPRDTTPAGPDVPAAGDVARVAELGRELDLIGIFLANQKR